VQTTSATGTNTAARKASILALLCCVGALSACQAFRAESPATARLDTATGATVGSADALMVFARVDARYSRSARDYIYLAPAETNRQGLREYFLWVGVASTLDRGFLAPETEVPTRLVLMIRSEPMEFELSAWPPPYLSTEAANLYRTPVALRAQLAAPITLDQLDLIDANRPESIRISGAAQGSREFTVWPTSSSWREFLTARP